MTDKQYDTVFKKHAAQYGNTQLAQETVREYIQTNGRILYGGMCIDMALKAVGHDGIYEPDTVPDYDFMSPTYYEDSIELAQKLNSEGYADVNSINAYHITTRRVRIDTDEVADISYIPQKIYDQLPTVDYDGFRLIHPDFQRLDMHHALSLLLENPPKEVVADRVNKDIKRFGLLNEAYPIPYVPQNSKMTVRKWDIPEGVIDGFVALAALLPECKVEVDKQITVTYPEYWGDDFPLCFHTDSPYQYVDKTTKYYSRYLDNYHPRALYTGKLEIYDNLGTLTPYWVKDKVMFANIHSVAMYMLLRSFSPPIAKNYSTKADTYRHLYSRILTMLDEDHPGIKLSLQMYGKYNWPLTYISKMYEERTHLVGQKVEVNRNPKGKNLSLTRITLKLGYYPARGQPPEEKQKDSELFTVTDGELRDAFTALVPGDN